MSKNSLKICAASLLAVGLVACGPDDTSDNSSTNNSTTNNSTSNNMTTNNSTSNNMTTNNSTSNNMTTNNSTSNNMTTTTPPVNNTSVGNNTTTVEEEVTCDSDPRPERCDADPATFDAWGAASVVASLEIVADDSCCFDFDGDDVNDNGLGDLLASAGSSFGFSVDDANSTIQGAIDDGSIALLLEHQDLAEAGGDFSINFLLGAQDGDFTAPVAEGGNTYTIDPASFDEGVWPQARVGNANLDGTTVTGGPGTVGIAISLFGATLNLRVTAAQLNAEVDSARTAFDGTGVALVNGEIGGIIKAADLFDSLNNFFDSTCGCVSGVDGDLISYNPDDIANTATTMCAAAPDTSGCDENDDAQSACATIVDNCETVVGFLPLLLDIDSRKLGENCEEGEEITCDSLSVGLEFEAHGAAITGVGAGAE